jgi:tRNA-dihydrouridine synthase A
MCGLSPAQNRSVPPLRYDAVHRLASCFPDMRFVLNGGLHCCDDFDAHLGTGRKHTGGGEQWEHFPEKLSLPPPPTPPSSSSSSSSGSVRLWPPVQGVMVGREAYHNPWAWADVDWRYYGTANPCVSRREALLAYIDYAEAVLEGGCVRSSLPYLVKPLHNFFSGCPSNKQYKQRLDGLVKEHADRTGTGGAGGGGAGVCVETHVGAGRTGLTLTEVVLEAVRLIPPSFLDARMGQGGQMVSDEDTCT